MDKPPPYKAVITIEVEGPSPDEFGQAISNAFDTISFGSTGANGSTANGTQYSCKVVTNLPSEPMTLDNLLGMLDEHCDPEQRRVLRETYGEEHLKAKPPKS